VAKVRCASASGSVLVYRTACGSGRCCGNVSVARLADALRGKRIVVRRAVYRFVGLLADNIARLRHWA
jgi:hypothetical protein